jgi:hypothetical protein
MFAAAASRRELGNDAKMDDTMKMTGQINIEIEGPRAQDGA